jgi:hypothetical protein
MGIVSTSAGTIYNILEMCALARKNESSTSRKSPLEMMGRLCGWQTFNCSQGANAGEAQGHRIDLRCRAD